MTEQIKRRSEKEDRQLDAMIQGLQLTHAAFDRMCDSLAPIVATAREMAYHRRQGRSRPDEIREVKTRFLVFPQRRIPSSRVCSLITLGHGVHNVLKILAQLSNIDKHRHLHVTMGRAAVHRDFTLKGGRQITSTRGGFKHGTKVPLETIEFDEVVDVNTRISTYITFDEPTVGINAATIEVQYALQMCIEVVESAVIPSFSQLLKNP